MIRKSDKTVIGFGGRLAFYCPGCGELHAVNVPGHTWKDPETDEPRGPVWRWNGDYTRVTIHPSLGVYRSKTGGFACHLFLRNGELQYLNDSQHHLAGRTVPLPDLPLWVREMEG